MAIDFYRASPSSNKTEIASEGLKGRVFEFSLGDLNNDEDLVREETYHYRSLFE